MRSDWDKFALLAAITEAAKNLSQLHYICFKMNPT